MSSDDTPTPDDVPDDAPGEDCPDHGPVAEGEDCPKCDQQ